MAFMSLHRPHSLLFLGALLLISITSLVVVDAADISGKIVSCSGCRLNKLRNVKKFLKAGEALWYQNVEIEYISHKAPTLTIFEDGEEKETLNLADYDAYLNDLHVLFTSKGFVKKSEDEIEEIQRTLGEQFVSTQGRRNRERSEL